MGGETACLTHPSNFGSLSSTSPSVGIFLRHSFASHVPENRTSRVLCCNADYQNPGLYDYGACIPPSRNSGSARNQTTHRECTYGACQPSWLANELQRLLSMQKKPTNGIMLTRGSWSWDVTAPTMYQIQGLMQFFNVTRANEIFINEVYGKVQLLSNTSINDVTTSIQIRSNHPRDNPGPRKDGYWSAYITRAGETTAIEVVVHIHANERRLLEELQALRIDIEYISYGPHGRSLGRQHVILPLQYPDVLEISKWKKVAKIGAVLPIRTHLLSHMDDPLEVLHSYVIPRAKPGDIIAVGETPLAIMQGRFRHPSDVYPGLVAKLACRLFHPTSSLATACGMQALIDISGRLRVIFAVAIAVIARIAGIRGIFYRLAGDQARLIDDVSGTLPPYDQFITLGPVQVQAIADDLKKETGFGVAIVDVNDLKQVQILAASEGLDYNLVKAALLDNPSGNSDEQTPITIIRPMRNA